jgi:histidyl-tRNA synthetase
VVHQGELAQATAFRTAEALRDMGLDVILHCGGGNFKAQFKKADASGAAFAVIIGEDEVAQRKASVKSLRVEGQQVKVALSELPEYLMEQLGQGSEEDEE